MSELVAFLKELQGSAVAYLLALAFTVALLILRGRTLIPTIKRRALISGLIFVVFAILSLPLLFLDKPTATTPNPAHTFLSVLSNIVFAFALLYALKLLLVEVVLVGRMKMEVPRILFDVGLVAVFFVLVLIILSIGTDLNVTGALGTAGVLSIVIGLALQDTLGNVFAGLALQLERPYQVGDWVSFGNFEGVITDVSWRSTQFRTRTNDLVTVPNSTISKESFINYSAPSRISGRFVYVGVAYRHPPAQIKRALFAACAQVPEILKRPEPLVRLKSFDASAITYEIKFWIDDFSKVPDIEEAFRSVVWYVFQREEIEIPFPIQVEYQYPLPTPEEQRATTSERVLERLAEVDFLAPLSEMEMRTLASRTKLHTYYKDETIIREGDEGDWFFVLDEGKVTVCVSKDGRQEEVARLEPPAFFGEMGPLTGERRSATVRAAEAVRLLVIDGEMFKSIIIANPDLATSMSEIIAQRQVELAAKRVALDKSLAAVREEASKQLLARIRSWFGFSGPKSVKEA